MRIFLFFLILCTLHVRADMLYAREKEFVVRVYYNTPADINKLSAYDIHEYNNRKDRYFLATVNEQLYQQLKNEGWKVSIDTDS